MSNMGEILKKKYIKYILLCLLNTIFCFYILYYLGKKPLSIVWPIDCVWHAIAPLCKI